MKKTIVSLFVVLCFVFAFMCGCEDAQIKEQKDLKTRELDARIEREKQPPTPPDLFPDATNLKWENKGVSFDIVIDGKIRRMFYADFISDQGRHEKATFCLEGCN